MFLSDALLSVCVPTFTINKIKCLKFFLGLPPFEWWREPPDKIKFRAYLFNVTNSEEFMSGKDSVLNVQEVGPIVYK